jgi:hypothetical protein
MMKILVPTIPGSESIILGSESTIPGSESYLSISEHPLLFFNDIGECPGYMNHNTEPWKSSEENIILDANQALKKDFTLNTWPGDPYEDIMGRAGYAKSLALAWQITGSDQYALKATEALLNIGKGDYYSPLRKSCAIRDYSIAYDMVQTQMSVATDAVVRDKLADFADECFNDLNGNGKDRDYVTFWDYHGQAYINVAFAGLVLEDYTNPNRIGISSGPDDWLKCGTDYYFVRDPLHNDHKPIAYYGLDSATGKDLIGYNGYTLQGLVLFAQAYTHVKGENYLDRYPVLKGHFTAEVWDSYPNDIEATYETLLNIRFNYQNCIANLLDDANRSAVLRHYDNVNANIRLMPDPSTEGAMSSVTRYLCEYNYNGLARNPPPYTNHLDPNAMFQTLRTGWNTDSDFLSMVTTQQIASHTARLEARSDQLAIQYYGKGDLLIADGGEDKYILDRVYGLHPVYHNMIVIENPRTPFGLDPISGAMYRGAAKGDTVGIRTPATVSRTVTTPWSSILTASEQIMELQNIGWTDITTLSTPINFERTILCPGNEYYAVIDRANGKEAWTYRNIWRLASFNTVKTTSPSNIGYVNGDLQIGSSGYDWLGLAYAKDINTGINTSRLKWSTVNPYGQSVELQLYSVPSSDVYITKHVSSIGGNGASSNVYSPVIYFRTTTPGKDLYRVTALLSSYATGPEASTGTVNVTGTGNALSVVNGSCVDIIYTGAGTSTIGSFVTDAETMFVRFRDGQPEEYTLLNGKLISYHDTPLVELTAKADYLTLKKDDTKIMMKMKCDGNAEVTLGQITMPPAYSVTMDGAPYDSWEIVHGNTLRINAENGEHQYEITRT